MIPVVCRRLQVLAERDPRRAVPLAHRALATLQGDDPIIRAWAEYTLGWALLCWERFDEARPYLREAQEAFEAHGVRLVALRCRHALLAIDLLLFARPNLEHEFALLADQFALLGDSRAAARARLDQARQLTVLGRSHDAAVVLDQIEPIMAQGDRLDRARWLRVQGVVANLRGDYECAIATLGEAEQFFLAVGARPEIARCWLEQAWVALCQEQLDTALVGYQRAQRMYERLHLPLRLAFCAKNIGLLHSRRGEYDQALGALLIAITQFTAVGRTNEIAGCLLNLGNIYFYTARWEGALAYYQRAEAVYTSAGVVSERLIAQRNRAMVYRAQGRRSEAMNLLATVAAEAQALGNRTEVAEARMNLADLLADEDRIDEAILHYKQAHDLFAKIGNRSSAAEAQLEQGWLALRRGTLEQAQTFFQSAAPALDRHPHHQWRVNYGLARCAAARHDTREALEYYCAASATVATLRRRLASEQVSSSLFAQAARLYADALRLAAASGAVVTAIALGEEQRALVLQRLLASQAAALPEVYQAEHDRLRQEISALVVGGRAEREARDTQLDAALAAYGELLLHARHSTSTEISKQDALVGEPFDIARARAELGTAYGTEWTALVYLLSGDSLLIGVVTPGELALEQTAYDSALRRLIERASRREHRYYTYRDIAYLQGRAEQPWLGLRTLAERLLPDLARARLNPGHRLLIAPAGPLHGLPWAALRLRDSWLAERAIVQVVPSLATWQALASRPPAQSAAALLIGCSAFGRRAPPLPTVADELCTVAARLPAGCRELLDEQATRAALLDRSASGELAGYRLLHVASHAQLLPARGLAAHLKLWDGDLLLPEVASLRLGGGLVVLSACDGAAADALPGEEVLSLSWALLAAGASGVLASLWPLDDSATPRIMAAFYDALRQQRDAATALAHAQRALIAATDGNPAAEPQSWGSFVLTGS